MFSFVVSYIAAEAGQSTHSFMRHISAGITQQTGCGGGGGFSLTDLSLQSHLFF